MARQPLSEIVIGQQGGGKTYNTLILLKQYVKKYKRPVLIVDKNGEYTDYKAIYYDARIGLDAKTDGEKTKARIQRALGKGKSGKMGIAGIKQARIYRIVGFRPDGVPMNNKEMLELILTITDYFKNGLLVLEEMNTYIRRHVPEEFYSFLVRLRHRGIDLISHFQRIGDPHPDIWGNAKSVRLHKYQDTVTRSSVADKIPNYELVRIAEIAVDFHFLKGTFDADGKYYFLYVDFNNVKIRGMSETDFRTACKKYLYQNPMELNNLLKEKENGKKKYSDEQAMNELINQKMRYIT